MTEMSPAWTLTTLDDPFEKRVSTVGRVFPHVECKIVDPSTGRVVPRGTPGEMLARGYHVMLGYWNNPRRPLRRSTPRLDADWRPGDDGPRRDTSTSSVGQKT